MLLPALHDADPRVLESAPGHGTRACLYFPATLCQQAAHKSARRPEIAPRSALH